ncbi:hypothetical protein EV363DRAFT_1438176 [Boletus edulis]|nr:hypothetical protein EV363DRAFT_1438176 [Boletus edulis]
MHPQGFPSPSSTNNIDDNNNNAMMRRRRRRRVPTSRSPITIAIALPCKRADDEDATTQQRRGRTLDERTSTSTQLDRARLCTPPPSSKCAGHSRPPPSSASVCAPVTRVLRRPPPASGCAGGWRTPPASSVWDSAGMRSDESYSMGGPIILLPSCLIWGWLNRCGRWRIFCLAWSCAHWIFKRDADTASELEVAQTTTVITHSTERSRESSNLGATTSLPTTTTSNTTGDVWIHTARASSVVWTIQTKRNRTGAGGVQKAAL